MLKNGYICMSYEKRRNKDYSRVYDGAPTDLIVRTDSFEDDCSFEIEIYDYYIE